MAGSAAERAAHGVIMKRSKKILTIAAVLLAVVFLGCAVYVNDYYHADTDAVAAFSANNTVTTQTLADGTIVCSPEDPSAGFIFYPGGKVEYTAYQPLMEACAQKNILCVLVEMPFNLAVLDINAAHGIREQFPQVETWIIGGHSLGGSMAAAYAADHTDELAGLVLLGAYSTEDLTSSGLRVLSVYGSEDRVMNREKYAANLPNLPADFSEIIIDGGCHAGFGFYGPQAGDGTPTLSAEEQIEQTAEIIAAWCIKNEAVS